MSIGFYNPANARVYTGLSSDTKPASARIGDKFIETDTQKVWMFFGPSGWLQVAVAIASTGTAGLSVTI